MNLLTLGFKVLLENSGMLRFGVDVTPVPEDVLGRAPVSSGSRWPALAATLSYGSVIAEEECEHSR